MGNWKDVKLKVKHRILFVLWNDFLKFWLKIMFKTNINLFLRKLLLLTEVKAKGSLS